MNLPEATDPVEELSQQHANDPPALQLVSAERISAMKVQVNRFFKETLAALRSVAESVDHTMVSEETSQPASFYAAPETPKEPKNRVRDTLDDSDPGKADSSRDRLAVLARQLEEKLQRSQSQE